jgi:hypothetical protein
MILVRLSKVRLLEDERHPERALPEIDRTLPGGPNQRDVMDALDMNLFHRGLLSIVRPAVGRFA